MYDQLSGDIYVGEYLDGKRVGRGKMYYCKKKEIYDGDWANDRRQGEGIILNSLGEMSSGDFRQDLMEGKMTYRKTLSEKETKLVFETITKVNDIFISIPKEPITLQTILSKAEISNKKFNLVRAESVKRLTIK